MCLPSTAMSGRLKAASAERMRWHLIVLPKLKHAYPSVVNLYQHQHPHTHHMRTSSVYLASNQGAHYQHSVETIGVAAVKSRILEGQHIKIPHSDNQNFGTHRQPCSNCLQQTLRIHSAAGVIQIEKWRVRWVLRPFTAQPIWRRHHLKKRMS